jgi:2-succinyl-6-hydroxy-2,4-cyclohexadiene-1-carboxylate synthase
MPRLRVNGVRLNVEVAGAGDALPLVLLHGFTGSAAAWEPHLPAFAERARVIAVDHLGHGASDAPADPDRYRLDLAAADVLAVLDRLAVARPVVLGYSMGGRLALYLAATAQHRLRALVAVSAAPGLPDDGARRARAADDAALADAIERDGVPAFVERWERQPLFATQRRLPPHVQAAVRRERLRHTAVGLANSLRGMGQGAQPALHARLARLRLPALIVAGALDARYCALARDLAALIPGARLAIVPEAGHAVHLEQPARFRDLVLGFLETLTAQPQAR